MKYECNDRDPCVFRLYDDNGVVVSSIFMHVDDGYFSAATQDIYDNFVKQLNKNFPYGVTWNHGDVHEYLGMIMDFSTPGKCHLTMKKYIESMINEWNVTGKREYPHVKELFNIDPDADKLDQKQHESFHRYVGKLIYLAHHCRPDILCSTIFL